ncbi:MAG: Asp23/Gls24 family envelope stress response protein [Fusobacteriaceae bacterium]|jgi:uncharacterized alkaline shock family protein YloU|nr:Asp23/Gls24 family envelope stress response protein [Fusobacteriaceae bacterium]
MSELGNIKIADDVVKTIAAKAAGDVKGVYKLAGGGLEEVGMKFLGKKRQTNGIKVEIGEKDCKVEVFIIVEYGHPISVVAKEVQQAVLGAISDLCGLNVAEVNVYVQDVKIKSDDEPKEEAITNESSNPEETGGED